MAAVRLLHLDAARLTAYRWAGSHPVEEGRYANDPGGWKAFHGYSLSHPRSVYRLLADIQDEGFGFESIPYVMGADRKALIRRKLGQHFLGTPFTCAISHGRDPAGRRDERMLFLALTRAQLLEPWLAALRAAQAQLAGIYSAPLVCQALAGALKLERAGEAVLLVTSGASGVRQSCFVEGRLRFSRLSALTGDGVAERARICAEEPAKLYQYLVGQRILARGTRLPTIVLCDPSERAMLAAACPSAGELEFDFASLRAAESACGLRGTHTGGSADSLLLHLLATRPPKVQFAPEPDRHLYRIGQVRFAMLSGAAIVLAGCVLASAKHLYEARAVREQARAVVLEAGEYAARHRAILDRLPPVPAALEDVRAVVDRYEEIERRSAPIEPMLRHISQALEAVPEIELERVEWQLTTRPEEAGASIPGAANRAAARAQDRMLAVAVVSAAIEAAAQGDRRRIFETIEEFAAAFRRDPDVQVGIVQRPFDIDPGRALKSAGGDGTGVARFVLRVSYPVRP